VQVKVLDIDRERQRISLGLKQTQSDPWQQVLEQHKEGDVVEGKVTKVVTFGAFVEILPGVEGLVHISELAQHHVENPREVVSQGDTVPVLILEVDAERRRLSLSLKRVDADRREESEGPIEGTPHLDLSEDVFSDSASAPPAPELDAPPADAEAVEPEAVSAGHEVDPAAVEEAAAPTDEAPAPAEPVSDEH
jgi:small subunit ribosomal protein S1